MSISKIRHWFQNPELIVWQNIHLLSKTFHNFLPFLSTESILFSLGVIKHLIILLNWASRRSSVVWAETRDREDPGSNPAGSSVSRYLSWNKNLDLKISYKWIYFKLPTDGIVGYLRKMPISGFMDAADWKVRNLP